MTQTEMQMTVKVTYFFSEMDHANDPGVFL